MIDDILRFLLASLNAHLETLLGRDPEPYAVASALTALDGTPAPGIEQRVILTVVNFERENALGSSARRMRPSGDGFLRQPAPVSLNVYLLLASQHPRYPEAMKRLSLAIGFVQANPVFEASGTTGFPTGIERFTLEMVNLDFQALNNLWGTTGARYLPSVVLKLRMFTVDQDRADQRIPAIHGVEREVRP